MNSPKVLDPDSLLQNMNSLQIRTNTVTSVSEPNLEIPRNSIQRICHLCMEEFGTLKDLQNHIPTSHNLNHPITYYRNCYSESKESNSTLGYYKLDTTPERTNSVSESSLLIATTTSEYISIQCTL